MNEIFTIYRSSAGSGKTRTLAKEYLKLALRHRSDYFKYILAVTFTNKATQEMKERILQYLNDFASGKGNKLAEELKAELKLDDLTFRNYCQDILSVLLHQYDHFHISTIDAFFQQVIRSFTHESGLIGDYRLEVELDIVLEDVIDNLVDELGDNKNLTEWVVEFAKDNLENERAWDIRYNLIEFSKEIFREEFKAIEDNLIKSTAAPGFFKNLKSELQSKKFGFITFVTSKSKEALEKIHANGLNETDFKYGGGVYNFFKKFSKITSVKDFDEKTKGKRPDKEYQESANWPDKETPNKSLIIKLAEEELIALLIEMLDFRVKNYKTALTAEVLLMNYYSFGLIADITRKLKEYKEENNLMLLADAPKFLNGIIQDSDTPFIYEKVGSFYRNYLIDEFQDTSGMQWKNFLPLLVNSLDQGYPSLVVGDVKQAIYRWRGGDLKLLQQEVEAHIGKDRSVIKALNSNFRSASTLVNFNNALFQAAAHQVFSATGHSISTDAYKDVGQQLSRQEEGFVQVKFLREDDDIAWKEKSLELIPTYLEKLQHAGVKLREIAILVRKNEEGQQIVSQLLSYKSSGKADPSCRYDVISNESLRLGSAATVNLLVGAMKYLLNTEDIVARAELGYEFAKLHEPGRILTDVFAVSNNAFFEENLPASFTKQKAYLKKLPLIELTETLIEIFRLSECTGELAYLQAFQDFVLDFYSRERNDLGAFLEWWEGNKNKKSIQVSGDIDAVQLLTVHKSKGLQFGYVILPFCSWGLDHEIWQSPNLWARVDTPPFDKAGYLPVKYSSILEQTYFDTFYQEERTRTYLDNLNLLYVAMTRAEQGLIVLAPYLEKRGAPKTVSQLLFESIQGSEELKKNWNAASEEWNGGTWNVTAADEHVASPSLSLLRYPVSRWRDKLVIRKSAKGYFNDNTDDTRAEKINYGIHLHAVLSRIKYLDEIDDTLEKIIYEGLILAGEKKKLQDQLNTLLSNSQVADWFDLRWSVRTEVPVLLPEGKESRIDRLMIMDKKAIVVDFKTGTPVKEDQRQVVDYINTLRQMNFTEVEGYLLYVRTNQVISVTTGKPRELKHKRDKDQLDLGL